MYFCLCRGLTESEVEEARLTFADSVAALVSALGLRDGRCCGRCVRELYSSTAPEPDPVYAVSTGIRAAGGSV